MNVNFEPIIRGLKSDIYKKMSGNYDHYGSLLLSNFAYTALDRLTGPLLGSHRRFHDDALYPPLVQSNVIDFMWRKAELTLRGPKLS